MRHKTATRYIHFFFFKGYGAPRDLPSSPTRRSSDLQDPAVHVVESELVYVEPFQRLGGDLGRDLAPGAHLRVVAHPLQKPVRDARRAAAAARDLGRSEEHTSELQSQSNLVCRLLLDT